MCAFESADHLNYPADNKRNDQPEAAWDNKYNPEGVVIPN